MTLRSSVLALAAAWFWAAPAFAVRPLTPPAPEFPAGMAWLNSEELSLKRLHGRKVAVVAFLNVSSLNSIRTFPVLKTWWDRYSLDGLMIIGVHTPDFEIGRDPLLVRNAVKRFAIRFPVVLDNDKKLWEAYQNEGWPVFYLIDPKGRIIYDHLGEGGYGEFENEIVKALNGLNGYESPAGFKPVADPPASDCGATTTVVYLGARRGRQKSLEGVKEPQQILSISRDGEVAYKGRWTLEPEALRLDRGNPGLSDFVRLIYRGAEAVGILGSSDGRAVKVFVKQDGLWLNGQNSGQDIQWDDDDRSFVVVSEPKVYYLARNPNDDMHELNLYPSELGAGVFGFDFSNSCQMDYERR